MTWQEALADYYRDCPTLNDENRAWLQESIVMDAPLIYEMELDQLKAIFSDGKDGINHVRLVTTLVWQCLGLVLCGVREPVDGNVRAFWYVFTDPVYSHFGLYQKLDRDPDFLHYAFKREGLVQETLRADPDRAFQAKKNYITDLSEDVIQQYVVRKVFRYQGPFKFQNANDGWALPGEGPASLIFFVEKQSLFGKLCMPAYKEHRISVIASRGYPSLVAIEYLADALRAKRIKNVGLAGLVDLDPDGWGIAHTYRQHFETMGFGIKSFKILTSTDLFTAKTLEDDVYPLDPSKKKVQTWFTETNGINGKFLGVHANSASTPRVRKALKTWVDENKDKGAHDDVQ